MSAHTAILCAHCSLPVPAALLDNGAERQFCCTACRTVFDALKECNLDAYYRMRDRTTQELEPARVTGKSYRECDDPAYYALHVHAIADGTLRTTFVLEGVHCAACAWLVEKIPQLLPGVRESVLDLGKAQATVTWDPDRVRLSAIAHQLDRLGYPPHPARGLEARDLRTREDRKFLINVGVAGALAGNIMLVAFALYSGMFNSMDAVHTQLFRWLSMVLGVLSLTWPGRGFFNGAWTALRSHTPHLDIPIALGLGVGGLAGVVNTLTGHGEIYFDSISVLVFLLLAGRLIQRRQQARADDAMNLLYAVTPTSARRVEANGIVDVPIEALQRGDVVEVRACESMPADGRIVSGESSLDTALLTGESLPRRIGLGDEVCAGMVNVSATVLVRVDTAGEDTRAGRLMDLVAQAARRRAPIVLFANRISLIFTGITLVLAALTFAGWYAKSPFLALDHSVALLIVACPCALGLATPLAVAVAIGRAARRRILIKNGEAIETLAKTGTIFLDKTGTLTEGRMKLVSWKGDEAAREFVVSLESHSAHPIARAFVDAWGQSIAASKAENVQQLGSGGITGSVRGASVQIGSAEFVLAQGSRMDAPLAREIDIFLQRQQTPVLVAIDGVVHGVAGFADPIRPDAKDAIQRLRNLGWKVEILSGDHPDVVRNVAQSLGVEASAAQGGMQPEQKLARVEQALKQGRVVMVGDGVNDAAGLAAASVGIAVHGGAEASLAAASVYLGKPGLAAIAELVTASRRTVAVVRRCMCASLLYNAFSVGLAAFGYIDPLIAAILMPISSTTVLSLAIGAKTFEEKS